MQPVFYFDEVFPVCELCEERLVLYSRSDVDPTRTLSEQTRLPLADARIVSTPVTFVPVSPTSIRRSV